MLMGTAISATACHQKEEYPSVPEVTEPQPTGEIIPTVDRQKELKDARKKYADAVAWLYMPGAEVDDPVVQAKDNAYYLQKDENGNYSEWGCYYAHCDNRLSSRSKLDRNTVIFGHSASNCDPDGPKLTKLHRYMDADYVKENPYVYLSVKGEDMVSRSRPVSSRILALTTAPEAQAAIRDLQQFITDHFYTCTLEILAGLGEMYVADDRFRKNIDEAGGEGTADFVAQAIRAYCGN